MQIVRTMNGDSNPTALPPFPPGYRASGVLLHVTSLPSPYGIGDVGPAAMKWIDLLHAAGQSWWQSLPLGPTGYGNSPYQALSSFAGNGLLVSPDWLIEDGLLSVADCMPPQSSPVAVDFDLVIPFKHRLLRKTWSSFSATSRPALKSAFEQFRHEQAHWLDDYALFRALKIRHGNAYYLEWPADLVERVPSALAKARRELANEIQEVCFAQFLLFRQGARIRKYARAKGIRLIGDLPFFVSPDSSDVWANPELFLLDDRRRPRFVAGVPPDYFSPDGQLWGNPVFDWEALRQTGYRWCIDRMRALLAHVDAIRLDHFRAFAAAWHIPAGSPTAQAGDWCPGPGADFFLAVQGQLGSLPFIVEDLGYITQDVNVLRDQFHFPATRVLQFAFDGDSGNPHLPHNYTPNTVVYTGTHDNPPTKGWYDVLPTGQRENVRRSLGSSPTDRWEISWELIRLAWSSVAALAIAPLQDLLNLGLQARMNIPGRAEGNWAWRSTEELLSGPYLKTLLDLTINANRRSIQLSDQSSAELKS
ncbi:MAG TPA: 4-alpha-glucanotransferase [Lacipirellulaceae bacterium]|nr:4-alpha-glucanotransferase [Lacipirellulaceae bacterium]